MSPAAQSYEQLTDEIAALRARLEEANETLSAIRIGDVDAVLVQGLKGDQLFTLKGADEPYRVLIEEMNQGAVTLSADSSILYCNRRFADLLKTPVEKIAGVFFGALVAPSERAGFAALLEKGRISSSAGEITLCAGDGSAVPMQLALGPLPAESAAAICLVATDISESRRAEEALRKSEQHFRELADAIRGLNAELERRVVERTAQLQAANQELEAFSYSVSHDLRAPLRHVVGFVELLQKDAGPSLSDKSRRHLTTISQASQKMENLIDDLLAFARIGQSEMRKTEVDLNELVRETMGDFHAGTKERKIMWKIHALPAVRADRALLRLVLVNLISNALKFASARAEAKIEIGSAPNGNGETVIFIRDNGAGFDPKYTGKLFGVFQRLHSEAEFEGTGIGLANVQRIIRRHGGRVWAEGAVDSGATFYFSIPKQKEDISGLSK